MDTENRDLITKANEIAQKAHYGQFRKHSNKPYISHCYDVVSQLVDWGINDAQLIAIALLHDSIEDAKDENREVIINEIESLNKNVADKVWDLTWWSAHQTKQEYLASFKYKSIDVLIIKIADRLCNVRDFLRSDKQYAVKYFNKADSLFESIVSRQKEIEKKFSEGYEFEYGEVVIARIFDSYEDVGLQIAYMEQYELCK